MTCQWAPGTKGLTTNQSMLFTVHSSPQAAILYSQLANITSMTNMPSTNDAKNMSLEILLSLNIVHSKDNRTA